MVVSVHSAQPAASVMSITQLVEVMTANPRRLNTESLVRDAVQMVREFRYDELPVVDARGKILGLIDVLEA